MDALQDQGSKCFMNSLDASEILNVLAVSRWEIWYAAGRLCVLRRRENWATPLGKHLMLETFQIFLGAGVPMRQG